MLANDTDGINNLLSGVSNLEDLSLQQIIDGTRFVLTTLETGLQPLDAAQLLRQLVFSVVAAFEHCQTSFESGRARR